MEKKVDRRVKYTLTALKEAMIKLLQEQHISKISVVSLCKVADVNRSTFYTHFKDHYDLLQYITQEALDNIQIYLKELNRENSTNISIQVLIQILDYVKENEDVFIALLSDNCDPNIQHEIMGMMKIVSPHDYKDLDARTKDYYMLFQINGCISILQKWLQDETPESTEEMSLLLLKVLGKIEE